MKNLIILLVTILSYQGYSQSSFTAPFEVNNETKLVHLFINTEFSANSIFVEKEYVETPKGTSLQNDNLVLIGDFQTSGVNYILDYENYLYYIVSFNPEEPIYILNNNIPSNITEGTLFFDNSSIGGPGDRTYWCDCGGEGPPAADPGGCVSQIGIIFMGKNVARCVKDGDECTLACIGVSTPSNIAPGGGLIVQVLKEKDLLFHNIQTMN